MPSLRFCSTWSPRRAALLLLVAISAQGPLSGQTPAGPAASLLSPAARAWRERSLADDPANLKGERPRARDTEEPLPIDQGRSGLVQMLRRLQTRGSLLMIVAHPDDEDGGMLTYVSRGLGARVGILTLTRGEGGQNVMSGDFDDALGLVRTRELLAADRYLGVDQMFGTEADFGFSKTIEEAFTKWTHDRVLYDAVRAVRLYRPLVIASVFIGAVTDGHGQHQVSGEIAQEVFRAAADPRVFPEMHLPPWQAQKVYARVPFATVDERGMYDYATGKYEPARFHNYVTDTWSTSPPQPSVTIPEGKADPLFGRDMSYVQFARQGLALQRSQIGGSMRVPPSGRFDVGYTRYGAVPSLAPSAHEQTFFDGIDTSLPGMASLVGSRSPAVASTLHTQLTALADAVTTTSQQLDAGNTAAVADTLCAALRRLDQLIEQVVSLPGGNDAERHDLLHELRVKRVQFNDAALLALGLSVAARIQPAGAAGAPASADPASPQRTWLTPGEPFTSEIALQHTGSAIAAGTPQCELLERFTSPGAPPEERPCAERTGPSGALGAWSAGARTPADAQPTAPVFSRPSPEQPFYTVADPRLRNAAEPPSPLVARLLIPTHGVVLEREQVLGAVIAGAYQPAMIVPAVSVLITPSAGVVPLGRSSFTLAAHVRALGSPASGTLHLQLPDGWHTAAPATTWAVDRAGSETAVPVVLSPGALSPGKNYTISAAAQSRGKSFSSGFETVGYPGITRDNLFRPAGYRAEGVAVAVPPALRVAYLPGTGDGVPASLRDIGIQTTTVDVADIAAGRLSGYDALLLGVRAYAAHRDLPTVTAQLLSFARNGGAVVLQYNSAEFDGNYGPYPYSLTGSAEKVVEEAAPVRLLDPAAQALHWPNQLTPADFSGWVEERGHGFMHSWDPRYAAPTEVQDHGQDPQRGGLLVAPVGKGVYVYCAFALYRQMPAGVPGAFRIMANLLSLSRHPH